MKSDDPEAVLRRVASRIAEIRREKGITQDQMAEALNTATNNYQRIEYGQNVTIKMLARIANALGVPIAEFFAPAAHGSKGDAHGPKPRAKGARAAGAAPSAAKPPASGRPQRRRSRGPN